MLHVKYNNMDIGHVIFMGVFIWLWMSDAVEAQMYVVRVSCATVKRRVHPRARKPIRSYLQMPRHCNVGNPNTSQINQRHRLLRFPCALPSPLWTQGKSSLLWAKDLTHNYGRFFLEISPTLACWHFTGNYGINLNPFLHEFYILVLSDSRIIERNKQNEEMKSPRVFFLICAVCF